MKPISVEGLFTELFHSALFQAEQGDSSHKAEDTRLQLWGAAALLALNSPPSFKKNKAAAVNSLKHLGQSASYYVRERTGDNVEKILKPAWNRDTPQEGILGYLDRNFIPQKAPPKKGFFAKIARRIITKLDNREFQKQTEARENPNVTVKKSLLDRISHYVRENSRHIFIGSIPKTPTTEEDQHTLDLMLAARISEGLRALLTGNSERRAQGAELLRTVAGLMQNASEEDLTYLREAIPMADPSLGVKPAMIQALYEWNRRPKDLAQNFSAEVLEKNVPSPEAVLEFLKHIPAPDLQNQVLGHLRTAWEPAQHFTALFTRFQSDADELIDALYGKKRKNPETILRTLQKTTTIRIYDALKKWSHPGLAAELINRVRAAHNHLQNDLFAIENPTLPFGNTGGYAWDKLNAALTTRGIALERIAEGMGAMRTFTHKFKEMAHIASANHSQWLAEQAVRWLVRYDQPTQDTLLVMLEKNLQTSGPERDLFNQFSQSLKNFAPVVDMLRDKNLSLPDKMMAFLKAVPDPKERNFLFTKKDEYGPDFIGIDAFSNAYFSLRHLAGYMKGTPVPWEDLWAVMQAQTPQDLKSVLIPLYSQPEGDKVATAMLQGLKAMAEKEAIYKDKAAALETEMGYVSKAFITAQAIIDLPEDRAALPYVALYSSEGEEFRYIKDTLYERLAQANAALAEDIKDQHRAFKKLAEAVQEKRPPERILTELSHRYHPEDIGSVVNLLAKGNAGKPLADMWANAEKQAVDLAQKFTATASTSEKVGVAFDGAVALLNSTAPVDIVLNQLKVRGVEKDTIDTVSYFRTYLKGFVGDENAEHYRKAAIDLYDLNGGVVANRMSAFLGKINSPLRKAYDAELAAQRHLSETAAKLVGKTDLELARLAIDLYHPGNAQRQNLSLELTRRGVDENTIAYINDIQKGLHTITESLWNSTLSAGKALEAIYAFCGPGDIQETVVEKLRQTYGLSHISPKIVEENSEVKRLLKYLQNTERSLSVPRQIRFAHQLNSLAPDTQAAFRFLAEQHGVDAKTLANIQTVQADLRALAQAEDFSTETERFYDTYVHAANIPANGVFQAMADTLPKGKEGLVIKTEWQTPHAFALAAQQFDGDTDIPKLVLDMHQPFDSFQEHHNARVGKYIKSDKGKHHFSCYQEMAKIFQAQLEEVRDNLFENGLKKVTINPFNDWVEFSSTFFSTSAQQEKATGILKQFLMSSFLEKRKVSQATISRFEGFLEKVTGLAEKTAAIVKDVAENRAIMANNGRSYVTNPAYLGIAEAQTLPHTNHALLFNLKKRLPKEQYATFKGNLLAFQELALEIKDGQKAGEEMALYFLTQGKAPDVLELAMEKIELWAEISVLPEERAKQAVVALTALQGIWKSTLSAAELLHNEDTKKDVSSIAGNLLKRALSKEPKTFDTLKEEIVRAIPTMLQATVISLFKNKPPEQQRATLALVG